MSISKTQISPGKKNTSCPNKMMTLLSTPKKKWVTLDESNHSFRRAKTWSFSKKLPRKTNGVLGTWKKNMKRKLICTKPPFLESHPPPWRDQPTWRRRHWNLPAFWLFRALRFWKVSERSNFHQYAGRASVYLEKSDVSDCLWYTSLKKNEVGAWNHANKHHGGCCSGFSTWENQSPACRTRTISGVLLRIFWQVSTARPYKPRDTLKIIILNFNWVAMPKTSYLDMFL